MGIMNTIFKQFARPEGFLGSMTIRSMNRGHYDLTTWGLCHLNSIGNNEMILDIGCGGGRTVKRLAGAAASGKVCGIDYSEDCVKASMRMNRHEIENGHVEIKQASVESLPFPDNMFDLATAVETVYFWPDLIENLKEVYRVLKPGGRILIINEVYRDEKFEKRNSRIEKWMDYSYFRPKEYEAFLLDAGFTSVDSAVDREKNWLTVAGVKAG